MYVYIYTPCTFVWYKCAFLLPVDLTRHVPYLYIYIYLYTYVYIYTYIYICCS